MCLVEETGDALSFSRLENLEWAELQNISASVGKMATRCAELFNTRFMANRTGDGSKDTTLQQLALREDHGATVDPLAAPPADRYLSN
jgi:hypothetical protein